MVVDGLGELYGEWSSHPLMTEIPINGVYKPRTVGLMIIPQKTRKQWEYMLMLDIFGVTKMMYSPQTNDMEHV